MTSTDRLPVPGTQATGTGRYQPRIGSMCTGYAGLDMAVQDVLGGTVAWHADPDPGASAVLAHHWPAVPNLGDITAVDWSAVEPVDIVTAGFPCQDISYAGRGEGIQEGNRSGLWHTIADALGALRPRIVVLENVRAIVVRRPGLDVVLADLARLGFDAEWVCVRASDVGAPHGRARWFLVAYPTGERRDARRPEPAGLIRRSDAALRRGAATADTSSEGRQAGRQGLPRARADVGWGQFEPAIRRWERAIGRPAPYPREPAPRGGERLNPLFVEWLMGLEPGHVTDVPGISRNGQLRLLGNGVVPQQAAYGLRILMAHIREVAA